MLCDCLVSHGHMTLHHVKRIWRRIPHGHRAWTVASELLGLLGKHGIDPLRARSVREAFKRVVKDALDGLAARFPTPIKVRFPIQNVIAVCGVVCHC